MPLQTPEEWLPHLDAIVASPGVTIVLGASDSGKTSFCTLLANYAFRVGVPTAVVDGDIGQSEIGPPTTVGLAFVEKGISSLGDLEPKSLAFVGSTSPPGHMLACTTSVKRMTEKAVALGRKLIIVDTTGLIAGVVGRALKTSKIELLGAHHIVALQHHSEAEHILRFFDSWENCSVHRLRVAPWVRAKPPELRAQRRAVRLREYFLQSEIHVIPLSGIATTGAWFQSGEPLSPADMEFVQRIIEVDVLYGEMLHGGVYIVIAGDAPAWNRCAISKVREYFACEIVRIIPESTYRNILVGLLDERHEVLALGIVQSLDFQARTAVMVTPLKSTSHVRAIRFGSIRIRRDGTEISRIHPGDI